MSQNCLKILDKLETKWRTALRPYQYNFETNLIIRLLISNWDIFETRGFYLVRGATSSSSWPHVFVPGSGSGAEDGSTASRRRPSPTFGTSYAYKLQSSNFHPTQYIDMPRNNFAKFWRPKIQVIKTEGKQNNLLENSRENLSLLIKVRKDLTKILQTGKLPPPPKKKGKKKKRTKDRARLANVWVKWRQKNERCIMGSDDWGFWS